jgi:hypothetical protein
MRRIFKRKQLIVLAALCLVILGVMFHPLPPHWQLATPLQIAAPITPLTHIKLRMAAADDRMCLQVLQGNAIFEEMPPFVGNGGCGIDPRVRISQIGQTRISPVETTCATALRLAMWEHHDLQPFAAEILGQNVAEIRHQGSYNCRRIRTTNGPSRQLSTHATAEAIDINGVILSDGQHIRLLNNWSGDTTEAAFFRALRDGACRWFYTVLGPDYNRLHADHFHMQSRGQSLCR